MILRYIIQGIGYGFSAAVQPGPFQAYLISQALNRGWRATLPSALAPLLSDGPIILLVLLVLSRIPEAMQQVLYIAGGLFILYLAWNAFNAWRNFDIEAITPANTGQQSVLKAVVMNALSPGPYIYWSLVTGPILLNGWRESPANGIGFLSGFYGTLILSLVGLILLFSSARRFGPKVNRLLLGISALALFGFGLYQLWLGVMG